MTRFIYEHCEFKQLSDGSYVRDYCHRSFYSSFEKCSSAIKDYLFYLSDRHGSSEPTFVSIPVGKYAYICFITDVNGEIQYHGVDKHILL